MVKGGIGGMKASVLVSVPGVFQAARMVHTPHRGVPGSLPRGLERFPGSS